MGSHVGTLGYDKVPAGTQIAGENVHARFRSQVWSRFQGQLTSVCTFSNRLHVFKITLWKLARSG